MRVFITGGTGFIGHYVARELLQSGHEVVILTRHPDKIPSLANHSKVKILVGTIYDAATISKGLEGCDACIHIALGWGETPLSMLENDTRATVLILQAASKAGCKKFIYTSSTAAMGKFRRERQRDQLAYRPLWRNESGRRSLRSRFPRDFNEAQHHPSGLHLRESRLR